MTLRGDVRLEKDLLGVVELPAAALYGAHTQRALENFPLCGRGVRPALIHAFGAVKLACARTNHALGRWDVAVFEAIEGACLEMVDGRLDGHVVVDALQGGAGTSTNMNVNEVLANRALQLLGRDLGDYDCVHPLEDINRHQSTNDTFPTALKVAAIGGLRLLEEGLVGLLEAFQEKEKSFARVVKVGRTQMQDAVLTTLGREMGAYAEAFGRDRWRVYKCEERLRVINLGGTAIGTGLGAPRAYIFRAVEELRSLTGFGLARAENLVEATQNADVYVEVSGILKACASSLVKVASDLRFLSSSAVGEVALPARQAGSSIMPGKVNPVVPEAVTQAGLRVMANDQAIGQAASMGHLELNAFLPLIAECLLESLELLERGCVLFGELCVQGLEARPECCVARVESSTALVTALLEPLGYEKAQALAVEAVEARCSIKELVLKKGWLSAEEYAKYVSPEWVTRLGSRDTGKGE